MSIIYDVINKSLRAAIVAALVLFLALPVTNFHKPEKAEALAPVVAVPVIFGTALTALGVYVAGTSAASYDANLNSVMAGFQDAASDWNSTWSEYVSAQGGFDAAMQSCVTDEGNISLVTLQEHGFFDSVSSYTAYCVDNGTAAAGTDSLQAIGNITIYGVEYPTTDGSYVLQLLAGDSFMQNQYQSCIDNGFVYPVAFYCTDDRHFGFAMARVSPVIVQRDAKINSLQVCTRSGSSASGYDPYARGNISVVSGMTWLLYSGLSAKEYNSTDTISAVATGVVVDDSVNVADTVAATPTVQPFEPTAEQLEQGYSYTAISEAVEEISGTTGDIATDVGSILTAITTSIGGVLDDIKTGVNGLENVIGSAVAAGASTVVTGVGQSVGALGDVVGDISTTLDNVWNGAQGWWADVLAWLGATPLAQLIAQIIAAINAGVLTLDAAIATVQEWIGTAVLDIVGAIEAIQIPTFPEFEFPPFFDLDENPGNVDGSASVSQFNQTLHDKAPFAYMFAFSEGFSSVSGYSDSPHFRVRHNFDLFDWEIPVDINAEPYLLYDLGGTTPAYLLRMSFSLALCMGVLYASYRLGLRAMSGGGE